MNPQATPSRASFVESLAGDVSAGKKVLLLAPLGWGKTHTLLQVRDGLRRRQRPHIFLDLFAAASTPERLLKTLAASVLPYVGQAAREVESLATKGATRREDAPMALIALFDLLATRPPAQPFVWLVDEVTEIRSLAYFPELGHIEAPLRAVLASAQSAVLTSSYLGLAADLFPDVEIQKLPGLGTQDLEAVPSLRSDGAAIATALAVTEGGAATTLPLVSDMRDSRDVERSLVALLSAGGALELLCRRHYEVLLLRSRGYAVSKRAAESVAESSAHRLTDLLPLIGRTAGASRQYLRWLVEVGLLLQLRKKYEFADPIVGLWASLYLSRGDIPSDAEIRNAVARLIEAHHRPENKEASNGAPTEEAPKRRIDRFEEID